METEMESASGEVSPYDSDSSAAMFSGPEKHPSTELDFVPTTPPRPGCIKSLLFSSWRPQKQSEGSVDLANQLPRWCTKSTAEQEDSDSAVDPSSSQSSLTVTPRRDYHGSPLSIKQSRDSRGTPSSTKQSPGPPAANETEGDVILQRS